MLLINNLLSQLAKICIQWRYFRDFCWWFFVCIEASRATRTHKSDTTQWFWLRSICYSNDGHERGTKQNKYSEFDSSRTATERESVMVMGDTLFLFTIHVDHAVLHEMHEKNKNAYIVYIAKLHDSRNWKSMENMDFLHMLQITSFYAYRWKSILICV